MKRPTAAFVGAGLVALAVLVDREDGVPVTGAFYGLSGLRIR